MVDRALRLLAAFDATHRRLTLSELSRRADLPLSTTKRLAERLEAWGALERDDTGRFAVGLRLYEVASLAPRGHGLREVAAPYMEDLYVVTREHVQLAVLEGSQAVMVERRSRPGAVRVQYRIGGKLPLLNTALGRVLLANRPTSTISSILDELTHPDDLVMAEDRAAVHAMLAEVRKAGMATIRRRIPEPVVAVAAPIRGEADAVVAALSIVVPSDVPPGAFETAIRTAARGISRAVGP